MPFKFNIPNKKSLVFGNDKKVNIVTETNRMNR